jgi:adenylate cyclase
VAEEHTKRKLAAIFSADVAGYSRLMADNEEATVRTINDYREVMIGLIREHSGRVVDAKGDNVLAEFPSVVDAVRCAVEVQNELKERNSELPEQRRMHFRIGVNLGDVIEEKETIYGDGVNVAARLEGLADAGGLCISGTAFDQVRDKLELGYEYLGEQSVKNIPRPVRSYKVLMEAEQAGKVIGEEIQKAKQWRWTAIAIAVIIVAGVWTIWNFHFRIPQIESASMERMAFPLPDKPSIAVLPFDNLTGNPEQDYVADGMTEDIISTLSKISELFVIARNSSFTYKGKPVKVQLVAEELGVRYILEGSVQKSDSRIRVTAQLIDALNGHHLWSEQFDRDLKNLFILQDEITKEIVVALQVELTHGEQARIWHKTTDDLRAWGCCVKAISLYEHFTREDNTRARQLLEQAVQLDPNYAYAWTLLAWTHFVDVKLGFGNTPSESLKQAVELATKASALDDTLPDVHSLWNTLYLVQRQYDKAVAEGEKSI